MRDFKQMKRQRGRNRGGGSGGSPSGKPQQNANRAFDSNGPDNIKVRGHAQHVFEKYQQLARDATSAGDRVLAENFLQHAEHYFRVLRTIQPNRPLADFIARDNFASGYDIDFEDESGAQALPDEPAPEGSGDTQGENQGDQRGDYQPRENRDRWENRPRDDRQRDDRPRDDRPRDDRPRDDRPRDDRPRDDRPRDDRPRDDRPRSDAPRDDRPRDGAQRDGAQRDGAQRDGAGRDRNRFDRDRAPRDGYRAEGQEGESRDTAAAPPRDRDRSYRDDRPPREDRPQREDRGERRERTYEPRPDRDPLAVVEPQAQPLTAPASDEGSSMLRSRDGETSHAPAFLQAASPAPAADDAPAKRPRGRPRKVKEETPEA